MERKAFWNLFARRRWNARKLLLAIKSFAVSAHKTSTGIERFLILFAALSGAWFMFFDVYPPNDFFGTFALKSIFWQIIFFFGITVHLATLYLDSVRWRKVACLYHSVVWVVWTMLALTAQMPTMATPLVFGLSAMGFYEAVRMRLKENE